MNDRVDFFTGLPPNEIPKYWDEIEPLIRKPLKRTGGDKFYDTTDVMWKCINTDWQLWIAWNSEGIDAAITTYIEEYPSGYRTFTIYLVGGVYIERWLKTAWSILKAYAKQHKCNEIIGMGREGWPRKLKDVESGEFKPKFIWGIEV